ncbi:MAG: PF20097 family protein [Ruminococcus sp.]|uniref:PF20097 family protein n=1 Tax=Ruminococcus sp. TaxID=41978 RepID=UPI0025EFF314|nr:PF20097 family protein [Ruminococcus sp.]MCR5541910.1 PF20097 family protein [Ruminococcus sp.]
MECPRCGGAMTDGILMGSGKTTGVSWITKEYRMKHAFAPMTPKAREEAQMVSFKLGELNTHMADVFWICRKCGIVMAELPRLKEGVGDE